MRIKRKISKFLSKQKQQIAYRKKVTRLLSDRFQKEKLEKNEIPSVDF